MNPNDVGIGSIVIGLLLVMGLAIAVYLFGVLIVSRFRSGRVNEESDITYPSNPQTDADRRALEQIQSREPSAPVAADTATDMAMREQSAAVPSNNIATEEELRERTVGGGMRVVRQSPTQRERPVDANHDRGVAPRTNAAGTDQEGDRSPL
jgi:hypothetical protein